MPFVWGAQSVFDAEISADQVELLMACRGAFAQIEETVGELLPPRHRLSDQWRSNGLIGQSRHDPGWAGPFQITQKSAGIGGSLGFENPDQHPAGCPITWRAMGARAHSH
jgi:hypothetical protein